MKITLFAIPLTVATTQMNAAAKKARAEAIAAGSLEANSLGGIEGTEKGTSNGKGKKTPATDTGNGKGKSGGGTGMRRTSSAQKAPSASTAKLELTPVSASVRNYPCSLLLVNRTCRIVLVLVVADRLVFSLILSSLPSTFGIILRHKCTQCAICG